MLDSWVVKGDLNDKFAEEKETISNIIEIQV